MNIMILFYRDNHICCSIVQGVRIRLTVVTVTGIFVTDCLCVGHKKVSDIEESSCTYLGSLVNMTPNRIVSVKRNHIWTECYLAPLLVTGWQY